MLISFSLCFSKQSFQKHDERKEAIKDFYGPSRDLLYHSKLQIHISETQVTHAEFCPSCSFQIILNKELSKLQKLNLDTRWC